MKNMFTVAFVLGVLGCGSLGETGQPVSGRCRRRGGKIPWSHIAWRSILATLPNFGTSTSVTGASSESKTERYGIVRLAR